MSNKQNSVQWFFDRLVTHGYIVVNKTTYGDKVKQKHQILLEQAKAMHKEEIKEALIDGAINSTHIEYRIPHYYNETFGESC